MHSYVALIYLVIPCALLYMLVVRGRRQRRHQLAMQAAIRPGRRVMTTSGVHATVVSLQDEGIAVLEIAPGVHTRWERLAVAEVFDPGSPDDGLDNSPGGDRTVDLTDAPTDGSGTTEAVPDHDGRTLT